MFLYKKFIVLVIFIFFTAIIWHLMIQRMDIIAKMNATRTETFRIINTPDNELTSVKNLTPVKIKGLNSAFLDLPIRQFCIKSSYNTAITGTYVNKDMIKYVLSRGCRYLDFEIFMIDGVPSVAYTTDPNFKIIDTDNSIKLSSAFTAVLSAAFCSVSPNSEDPVFINLRVKSNDRSIYQAIASNIHNILQNKLYTGSNVTNDTHMRDLMGKIVIIMDRTVFPSYARYCGCQSGVDNCYDLTNYVKLESGTSQLFQTHYSVMLNQSTIQINTILDDHCSVCTDIQHMRVIVPDTNYKSTQNPSTVDNLITGYGAQIVPYRFYLNDSGLADYEALFDNQTIRTAFVPIATAISYIEAKNSNN